MARSVDFDPLTLVRFTPDSDQKVDIARRRLGQQRSSASFDHLIGAS